MMNDRLKWTIGIFVTLFGIYFLTIVLVMIVPSLNHFIGRVTETGFLLLELYTGFVITFFGISLCMRKKEN